MGRTSRLKSTGAAASVSGRAQSAARRASFPTGNTAEILRRAAAKGSLFPFRERSQRRGGQLRRPVLAHGCEQNGETGVGCVGRIFSGQGGDSFILLFGGGAGFRRCGGKFGPGGREDFGAQPATAFREG